MRKDLKVRSKYLNLWLYYNEPLSILDQLGPSAFPSFQILCTKSPIISL